MFTLIRDGNIYTPEPVGIRDILIANGAIVAIAKHIDPPADLDVRVINAAGKTVVPGLVDGHIHFLGAGGGSGPDSRSSAVHLSTMIRAGVTTAVGVLGIDKIGFNLEELLIRSRALESEGLSTCILAGSYTLPSVSLTDSPLKDLYLIDKVIGVKIAVFETLSSHPDKAMLRDSIAETWLGGRMGEKAGVTVAHVGNAKGDLLDIVDLLDEMLIPPSAFVATHINRSPALLKNAAECGKRGLILDLSGNIPQHGMIPASRALKMLLDEGVPSSCITFSSDSGAAYAFDGQQGILPVDVCINELRAMVREQGLSLTQALEPLTINPARVYRLDTRKGSLETGKDADLVFLDEELRVDTVIARGKCMLAGCRPVVRGRLEEPLLENLP